MPTLLPSLAAVVLRALVHVVSVRLRVLDVVPRSAVLSFGGGVAAALVFLEILPELAEGQAVVARALGPALAFLDRHIYLVALFYALHRVVKGSLEGRSDEEGTSDPVFWLSMVTFALKNATVAYLLVREQRTLVGLLLFAAAIALEFLLGDRGLRREHRANYDRIGRWVLVAALAVGWATGVLTEVPEVGIALLNAFLAGAIVLTVLREELPAERRARIWPFALGTIVYAGLLLAQ